MKTVLAYKPKGTITFAYIGGTIQSYIADYPEHLLGMYEVSICGDIMSGKDFYNQVDERCIIDYDGSIGHIFIDGRESNLGLVHEGIEQGGFLVDGETWLDICDEFNVEVEWCNK